MFVWLLLFMLSQLSKALLTYDNADICAHEANDSRMIIGGRDKLGWCESYMQVDWDHYELHATNLPFDYYLDEKVCPQFKNGKLVSDFYLLFFLDDPARIVKADMPNCLYGFFPYASWAYTAQSHLGTEHHIHLKYLTRKHFGSEHTHISLMLVAEKWNPDGVASYSDHMTAMYFKTRSISAYKRAFRVNDASRASPVCPVITVGGGLHKVHKFWPTCQELYENRSRAYHKCKYIPYNHCEQEIRKVCHYSWQKQAWYDRLKIVIVPQDKPYGRPCSNWTYESIRARPCNRSCTGVWGEWSPEPTPPCRSYTLFRYQPHEGSIPCFEESKTCCPEVKFVDTGIPCEDFAYNTTINLRKEGCDHNQPLITGPTGHLMCSCSEQFTGVRCEIDLCSDKCFNGASCVTAGDTFKCICRPGFEGDKCQAKSTICGKTGICHNGGICVNSSESRGAYCKCKGRWGGDTCEDIAGFCRPGICNYHGKCYNKTEVFSFGCICDDGYAGHQCEIMVHAYEGQSPETITFGTVMSLVTVIIICSTVIIYAGHRHRKRKRNLKKVHASATPTPKAEYAMSVAIETMAKSTIKKTNNPH